MLSPIYFITLAIAFNLNGFSCTGGEGPENKKKGSFLNVFDNCLVEFVSDFKKFSSTPYSQQREKLGYIHHFTSSQVPVLFTDANYLKNSTIKNNEPPASAAEFAPEERVKYALETERRWLECYIQIHFIDLIVGARGDYIFLHKSLEKLVSLSKTPDAIVLVKPRSSGRTMIPTEAEAGFYANLYRLTLPSMFIVIDGPKKQVSMVCMHCRGSVDNQLKVMPAKDVKNFEDLHPIWHNHHMNLLGRSVDAIKRRRDHNDESYETNACDPFYHHKKQKVQTDPNICAQLAIGKSLNFTPFVSNNDFRLYGHIKYGMMSYAEYNEQTFLRPTASKYEWLTSGEYFEAFVYLTVVNKDALNLSALWRTFEPRAWLAIVSTFVTLILIFGLAISSRYEVMRNRLNNLRFSFILFTAILLEQTQLKIWKKKMVLNHVANVIIVTWILAAISFSSLYRATIYKYLTTSVPPAVPDSTEALVKSRYLLITSTSYHYLGKPYSTLAAILDEMMIGQSGIDYPEFYDLLQNRINFIPASPADIVSSYGNGSTIVSIRRQVDYLTEKHIYTSEDIRIPQDFAVIGSEFDVEVVEAMLDTEPLHGRHFVQRGSTVHTFLNRMPWIVRRNFFIKIFQPALAHLCESGLYEIWRIISEVDQIEREFHQLSPKIQDGTKLVEKHSPGRKKRPLSYKLHPKPLSLEVFDSAIVFQFACTLTCLAVFLIEWSFIVVAKFVCRRDRNMIAPQKKKY